ncbi:hypothetical protein [Campylobacter fetus]|uniref:hypothetical protein n=1 Tax=Campylobacter fetus TaxID=196 RepID=UPI00130105E8|nr:hypothetical protein [Campylobacter fetus]
MQVNKQPYQYRLFLNRGDKIVINSRALEKNKLSDRTYINKAKKALEYIENEKK